MENSEEVFQEFITDNYKRLTNHTLVTSGLLIDLFSKRVIDKDEKETILATKTDTDKNDKFWSILKTRWNHIDTIIQVLRSKSQQIPANILQECREKILGTSHVQAPSLASGMTIAIAQSPSVSALRFVSQTQPLPTQISHQLNCDTSPADSQFIKLQTPLTAADGNVSSKSSGLTTDYLLKHYKPMRYESKGKYKGFALIVNVITFDDEPDAFRSGAQEDSRRLIEVLNKLNFRVYELNDPTAEVLIESIKQFQKLFDDDKVDSCIVAIMSHGMDSDRIYTKDGVPFSLWNSLVAKFSNKETKSQNLIGIPKIFLLNYCRGRRIDTGTTSHDDLPYKESIKIIPSWTDMLVCYSTLEGHYSYRTKEKDGQKGGSWFIQSFCDVIEKYADKYHLLQLLDIVSNLMRLAVGDHGQKQICPYYNIGFDKEFYFK